MPLRWLGGHCACLWLSVLLKRTNHTLCVDVAVGEPRGSHASDKGTTSAGLSSAVIIQ